MFAVVKIIVIIKSHMNTRTKNRIEHFVQFCFSLMSNDLKRAFSKLIVFF